MRTPSQPLQRRPFLFRHNCRGIRCFSCHAHGAGKTLDGAFEFNAARFRESAELAHAYPSSAEDTIRKATRSARWMVSSAPNTFPIRQVLDACLDELRRCRAHRTGMLSRARVRLFALLGTYHMDHDVQLSPQRGRKTSAC